MKIEANGIGIDCRVDGEAGPWVVLSHSLACASGMWDEQMAALAGRCRVLRFDTRGHGGSHAPEGPYSLELLAQDALALLDALGIERCHFVGLSMGGMIAQVLALAHPGRVASLVLADTTSRYPADAWPVWQERIRTVAAEGMEPVVEPTLARWFTPAFRERRPETVARIAGMIRSTPAAGYMGCSHAVPRINLTARLGAIRVPVLVMVGEDDPGTPVAMAREIHEAMPGSRLEIIPAAAHLSNVEQPETFNRLLVDFLGSMGGVA